MSFPSNEAILNDVRRLVAEEAHLIGLAVQDSLDHDDLHRRQALSDVLDQLCAELEGRGLHRRTP